MKFKVDHKNVALRLHVMGQMALDLGPYIIIMMDYKIIGKTVLSEDDWTSLVFTPDINVGEHVLSVEFTNDFNKPEVKQDRNVFLGNLDILYLD